MMVAHLCLCKFSRVSLFSSYLSHSLFFFNIKLYITKHGASLDLTILRSSILYLSVNQVTKVYSYVLYIDLCLVLDDYRAFIF
jgi:hypothetical protein